MPNGANERRWIETTKSKQCHVRRTTSTLMILLSSSLIIASNVYPAGSVAGAVTWTIIGRGGRLIGPLRGAAVYEVVGAMVKARMPLRGGRMYDLEDEREPKVESRAGRHEKLTMTSHFRKQISNGPQQPKILRACPSQSQYQPWSQLMARAAIASTMFGCPANLTQKSDSRRGMPRI
jgi:hypothetical protein